MHLTQEKDRVTMEAWIVNMVFREAVGMMVTSSGGVFLTIALEAVVGARWPWWVHAVIGFTLVATGIIVLRWPQTKQSKSRQGGEFRYWLSAVRDGWQVMFLGLAINCTLYCVFAARYGARLVVSGLAMKLKLRSPELPWDRCSV